MNWGAFAGGLATGIGDGVRLVGLKDSIKQRKKADEMEEKRLAELDALYKGDEGQQPGQVKAAPQELQAPQAPQTPGQGVAGVAANNGVGQQPAQPVQQQPTAQKNQQQPEQKKGDTFDVSKALNTATKAAVINMKYGKGDPSGLLQLYALGQNLRRENLDQAVGYMQAGLFDEGLKAYKSFGGDREDYEFDGPPTEATTVIAGREFPTFHVNLLNKKTGERFAVDTAKYMEARMGMEQILKANTDTIRSAILAERAGNTGGIKAGTYGKMYNDLIEMNYSPEESQAMVEAAIKKRGGGGGGQEGLTPSQKLTAMKRITELRRGGVDETNVDEYNELAETLNMPAMEKRTIPAEPGWKIPFTDIETSIGAKPESEEYVEAENSDGSQYGKRQDGTDKGKGYLGEQKMQDGSGSVATELSVGVEIDGQEVQIPTLIPTLTANEKAYLLKGGDPRTSPTIMKKAVEHARKRMGSGKSAFMENGPAKGIQREAQAAPPPKKGKQQDLTPLPKNKDERTEGTTYTGPDGGLYLWDGNGLIRVRK